MLQLVDGPCKADLRVRRAPLFLRAVKNASGEIDVLDQVEDAPAAREKIFIYQRFGVVGSFHLKAVNRNASGWYVMATYRHMPDVQGEQLRNNEDWQRWAANRANSDITLNNSEGEDLK